MPHFIFTFAALFMLGAHWGCIGAEDNNENEEDTKNESSSVCIGLSEADCEGESACEVVTETIPCSVAPCEEAYLDCLEIDATCSMRNQALCSLGDGCLTVKDIENDFVECRDDSCTSDEDCPTEHYYSCNASNKCMPGPVPCTSDDDCPNNDICWLPDGETPSADNPGTCVPVAPPPTED